MCIRDRLIIVESVPNDLLAREKKLNIERNMEVVRTVKDEVRLQIIHIWEECWNQEPRERRIARLNRHLGRWNNRLHGEANNYLMQFLSRHGYFLATLNKMGKMEGPG